jgi:hypothetical protein
MLGIVFVGFPKRTSVGMSFGRSFAHERARRTVAMQAAPRRAPDIPFEFLKVVLLADQGLPFSPTNAF